MKFLKKRKKHQYRYTNRKMYFGIRYLLGTSRSRCSWWKLAWSYSG